MPARRFQQVDVFSEEPLGGNPVAVVVDGDGLDEAAMARFARWTNLSETTFVLPPTDPAADYRVRIFTPDGELPFAGHPTLGTAHAWLASGGSPAAADVVVQECGLGPVRLRRGDGDRLAFAAPPCRIDEVAPATVAEVAAALGLAAEAVADARMLDNGPQWLTLLVADAATVLALEPDLGTLRVPDGVGVVGPHPDGHPERIEVRAFVPGSAIGEDPVTGSLNASLAQWLVPAGVLPPAYVAAQGTVLGRTGRVHVTVDGDDTWIGGATTTVLAGTAEL